MMLNLPPRNGYLPIMKIISIQARHIAADATTLRTSRFSMKSIAVSASDKIHNLNQLSSSRKYLRPIARYYQNCCRNSTLREITRIISTLHNVGSAKFSSEEHPVKNRDPPFVFFETLVSFVFCSLETSRPCERDIKDPVSPSDL